jgi:hypothetical protein
MLTALALALVSTAAVAMSTDKSAHNPTGDEQVEKGWKAHQDAHQARQQDSATQQEPSTATETTDHYGKRFLEEQVQGTKEPKVNRTY